MSAFLIVSVVVLVGLSFLYAFGKKVEPEVQVPESRNLKVKHILEARDMIARNEKVKFMAETMTNLYEREETPWVKDQRLQIMNKISAEVYDSDMVAAICAIAKMEASKRREKKNGKRVTGKIEMRR